MYIENTGYGDLKITIINATENSFSERIIASVYKRSTLKKKFEFSKRGLAIWSSFDNFWKEHPQRSMQNLFFPRSNDLQNLGAHQVKPTLDVFWSSTFLLFFK